MDNFASEKPLVSVITRTKNRSKYLRRCFDSISSQIFVKFEWIIVVDGLADPDTKILLSQIKNSRLETQIVENHSPRGMEAASNIGVSYSKCKYITFLDDDDTWDSKFLEKSISFLQKNNQYKGVVCQTSIIEEVEKNNRFYEKSRYVFNPDLISIGINQLCKGNIFTNNSFVFEKSIFDEIGKFDEELIVKGDWDFNLRFIEKYDIGVISEVLSFWHHHFNNSIFSSNSIHSLKKEHQVFDDIIRNKYFRRDLDSGLMSIGYLLVANKSQNVFRSKKNLIQRLLGWL
ncbi:glycosyltransferase [Algoriphagus sp. oki45]|uniref:glycosyltransferase family 2 protein n=1 Tax=Algoriphagus sp. oki45 TaxID=3067294 RepID=UPI0027EC4110|nr:glycosyltransferase [Algoriphagus sp. oki45]